MTNDNHAKTTVLEMYAAFGRGDVPAILAKLHPEVSWGIDGAPAALAFLQRGTGKDAAVRYFQGMGGAFEVHGFAPLAIAVDGDRVLSLVEEDFTVRATGKRLKTRSAHVFRVDAAGRIVDYSAVIDTAAFAAASTR